MITKDSIEAAYCFFHQKYQVYAFSNSDKQKDDIEYAISLYVEQMNSELYKRLGNGRDEFLLTHTLQLQIHEDISVEYHNKQVHL